MKIVKHYWFVAIALITMISFSSCESDEERGFDISGLYGKTWWGDMGFEDRYGEPLYSYITFTSGAFTDHGVGTEERCYHNDERKHSASCVFFSPLFLPTFVASL